jgi:hypothetical protein
METMKAQILYLLKSMADETQRVTSGNCMHKMPSFRGAILGVMEMIDEDLIEKDGNYIKEKA